MVTRSSDANGSRAPGNGFSKTYKAPTIGFNLTSVTASYKYMLFENVRHFDANSRWIIGSFVVLVISEGLCPHCTTDPDLTG